MTPWKWLLNISNLYYLVAIALCSIAFIGYEMNPNFRPSKLYDIVFGISVIGFFLKNSSFVTSKYFKLLNLSIAFLIIGSLLKLMHWPLSLLITSIGLIGAFLIYFIYFLNKIKKGFLDYLKIILALSYSTSITFTMMHYPYQLELVTFVILLLVINIILIIKKNYRVKDWFWN